MNIEKTTLQDILIFTLNEKRLDANISGLIKGEFTDIVKNQGIKKLVIDLTNVENCDSSGLSSLLVANRLINSVGGELRIVTPSQKILTLIKITQLDKVLRICGNLTSATEELQG